MRKGSCFVQICQQECEVPPFCVFTGTHLNQVMDSTVELDVFALVCCMNQHCNFFQYFRLYGFFLYLLCVSRVLPRDSLTWSISLNLSCTVQACINTVVSLSASAKNLKTISLPTPLHPQNRRNTRMLHYLNQQQASFPQVHASLRLQSCNALYLQKNQRSV